MLIIGTKGFAKEILEILRQLNQINDLAFFDNVTENLPDSIFEGFPVLKSTEEVKQFFSKNGNQFILGLGNPARRRLMAEQFIQLGGEMISIISPKANIGQYSITIGAGSAIMDGAILSTDCQIGIGCIIYYNSVITHDVQIGNYTEISPSATVLGRVSIGHNCEIGSNSTILPDVKIGNNVVVAAGSVVRTNIPDNCMVAGVPAEIKKYFNE